MMMRHDRLTRKGRFDAQLLARSARVFCTAFALMYGHGVGAQQISEEELQEMGGDLSKLSEQLKEVAELDTDALQEKYTEIIRLAIDFRKKHSTAEVSVRGFTLGIGEEARMTMEFAFDGAKPDASVIMEFSFDGAKPDVTIKEGNGNGAEPEE